MVSDQNKVRFTTALKKLINFLDRLWIKNAREYNKPQPFKPINAQEVKELIDMALERGDTNIDAALQAFNDFLAEHPGVASRCAELQLPKRLFVLMAPGKISFSRKTFEKLSKLRSSGCLEKSPLAETLFSSSTCSGEPDLRWYWDPLPPLENYKTNIFWPDRGDRIMDMVAFDPVFFPRSRRLLFHYLKIHLRHRLADNCKNDLSRSIAWFGSRTMTDGDVFNEVKNPRAILFNTGLLWKNDRTQHLLVLCTRNHNDDFNAKTPWVCMRVVLSGHLADAILMRRHLTDSSVLTSQNPLVNPALIDGQGRKLVPDVLRLPRELLTFDPDAYPDRIDFGSFAEHIKQERSDSMNGMQLRIPKEFSHLSVNDLLDRATFAVERARDCPNIVLPQWFCDKGADQGKPQLILPMSFLDPPRLDAHAGLVLDVDEIVGDDDKTFVRYSVKTILSLDMVYSNVLVLQPRGGHWLNAQHELVKNSPWLQVDVDDGVQSSDSDGDSAGNIPDSWENMSDSHA